MQNSTGPTVMTKQADPKVRLNDSSLTGADYVAV